MVTSYNEKDIKSFGEYVKSSIENDGIENFDINKVFKSWLYYGDKARFEVKDLVSFGNRMMEMVNNGDKKIEPCGKIYLVSDANIANWIDSE